MKTLHTSGDVIDELGGTAAVAAALGRTMTVVSNWRTAQTFPANTYLVLTGMLAARGAKAAPALWKMVDAGPAAVEPARQSA